MEITNLRELQIVELDMLKYIIKAFKEMGLNYYAIGGTALGAVRHSGFIPWDDDIDLALGREDYEKFIKEGQKYLPEHLFIQSIETENDYIIPFAKVRNSNTTFIEEVYSNQSINHGVYIDIFPLDNFKDTKISRWLFLKKRDYLWKCALCATNYKRVSKYAIKNIFMHINKRFYVKPKRAALLLDKHFQKYRYKDTQQVGTLIGAWNKEEIFPKEYFGKGVEMPFEDIMINIPTQYDLYLKYLYDDYMTLPPDNERNPHHYLAGYDLKVGYEEYLNK